MVDSGLWVSINMGIQKWLVYNGKSLSKMDDDSGGIPISGNLWLDFSHWM